MDQLMDIIIIRIHLFCMKFGRLNILNYFILVCLTLSCNRGTVGEQDISKIKITNYTGNHRIPHEIEITDFSTIDEIESGIDNLRLLAYTPNLRANTGMFELRLLTKEGKTARELDIIYTTYDGVIIRGTDESGIVIDKYYKNDKLEMLILQLFLDKKDQN